MVPKIVGTSRLLKIYDILLCLRKKVVSLPFLLITAIFAKFAYHLSSPLRVRIIALHAVFIFTSFSIKDSTEKKLLEGGNPFCVLLHLSRRGDDFSSEENTTQGCKLGIHANCCLNIFSLQQSSELS